MCLIGFDWQPHASLVLRLISNRDEFHQRPTQPLHRWQDLPIVGGRDLVAQGSWLAWSRGRVAALTNVRDLTLESSGLKSRGQLVVQALTCPEPLSWLEEIQHRACEYAGFNLLLATTGEMWHLHRGREGSRLMEVEAGVHTLSNASLDTPWPKSRQLAQAVALDTCQDGSWPKASLEVMSDVSTAPKAELPDTGVGLELEQRLAAAFILGEAYGTRAMTLLSLDREGVLEIEERSFGPMGVQLGELKVTQRPG